MLYFTNLMCQHRILLYLLPFDRKVLQDFLQHKCIAEMVIGIKFEKAVIKMPILQLPSYCLTTDKVYFMKCPLKMIYPKEYRNR